jgi:ABC-type multidrug transport system fused ATPase/permease subunit
MERDPLRLAWTTAPVSHLVGVLLLLAAGALLLIGIDFVRVLVDDVIAGGTSAPLLRIALDLPEWISPEPLVLVPGIALDPPARRLAALAALGAIPVLIALLLVATEWVSVSVGGRVLKRVRRLVLKAVLTAPPAARDDTLDAAMLVGDPLARESGVLGSALLGTIQAIGIITLLAAYVFWIDWHLGAALSATLILVAVLCARRLELRVEAARARQVEGAEVEQSLADLLRRIPALRAHGTGAYEWERLAQEIAGGHRPVQRRERRLALVHAVSAGAMLLSPLVVLGVGAWLTPDASRSPGSLVACVLAAILAALATRELIQRQRLLAQIGPTLAETARSVAGLQSRDRSGGQAALPRAGTLVAKGVSAYDPVSGARVTGVDLSLTFPAHVALVGDGDLAPRVLASLIGGQLHPSTGSLTFGGVDLTAAAPTERARRFAYAGGDTVLIPGTLRDNFLYGDQPDGSDTEARLSEAVAIAGLDRLVHARGLAGTLDPRREPKLAAAIVESRRVVQAALQTDGLARFVDPFDAQRYNHHATVGENILFGRPTGDTFQESHLASHPFMRAILEAEDLTKPLTTMGQSIAVSMIEIFSEIPDGHPLFERFGFFSAADRAYFEDLVERRNERRRRGAESSRDRERLIGLALRYSESRHRLGLIDEPLQHRILAARADFAKMLPTSLQPALEFYDSGKICTAASVQDNLLFGRIASEQAGAEAAVHAVISRVLTERGLDREVSRIGLESPVDIRGNDFSSSEIAAIDLVRCLVRQPDVLVVERALDGLPSQTADALVARLRRSLIGRGLMLVTSEITPTMALSPFDAVIRFERGVPMLHMTQAREPELMSA